MNILDLIIDGYIYKYDNDKIISIFKRYNNNITYFCIVQFQFTTNLIFINFSKKYEDYYATEYHVKLQDHILAIKLINNFNTSNLVEGIVNNIIFHPNIICYSRSWNTKYYNENIHDEFIVKLNSII